jgi:hypothetical protein
MYQDLGPNHFQVVPLPGKRSAGGEARAPVDGARAPTGRVPRGEGCFFLVGRSPT